MDLWDSVDVRDGVNMQDGVDVQGCRVASAGRKRRGAVAPDDQGSGRLSEEEERRKAKGKGARLE